MVAMGVTKREEARRRGARRGFGDGAGGRAASAQVAGGVAMAKRTGKMTWTGMRAVGIVGTVGTVAAPRVTIPRKRAHKAG